VAGLVVVVDVSLLRTQLAQHQGMVAMETIDAGRGITRSIPSLEQLAERR
jgi:hypothetical protein